MPHATLNAVSADLRRRYLTQADEFVLFLVLSGLSEVTIQTWGAKIKVRHSNNFCNFTFRSILILVCALPSLGLIKLLDQKKHYNPNNRLASV